MINITPIKWAKNMIIRNSQKHQFKWIWASPNHSHITPHFAILSQDKRIIKIKKNLRGFEILLTLWPFKASNLLPKAPKTMLIHNPSNPKHVRCVIIFSKSKFYKLYIRNLQKPKKNKIDGIGYMEIIKQ